MSAQLLSLLEGRVDRQKIISILDNEGDNIGFNFLVTHMQKEVNSSSWRSAWIINNAMKKNDVRIKKSLNTFHPGNYKCGRNCGTKFAT